MVLHGDPNCHNPGESKRVKIYNNLILLCPKPDTYRHNWLTLNGGNSLTTPGMTDYVIQHNTALMSDNSNMWGYVFSVAWRNPELPAAGRIQRHPQCLDTGQCHHAATVLGTVFRA